MPIIAVRPTRTSDDAPDRLDDLAAYVGSERSAVEAAMTEAATAEHVAPETLAGILDRIAPEDIRGLVTYVRALPGEADLPHWRQAWPTVLGPLADAEASAVIRLAVHLAGGVIVEPDGTEREMTPAERPRGARGDTDTLGDVVSTG